MVVTKPLTEYFKLMDKNPQLFSQSQVYPIVTDKKIIKKFQRKNHCKIGVIYKSAYNMLVVDLIQGENGFFTYERVISTTNSNGVVIIPIINGKLVLLNQYRHAIRKFQISFPRGFGEVGLSSEQNAQKELLEEIGAVANKVTFIGNVTVDSGLTSNKCDVFVCDISSYNKDSQEEGIEQTILLSKEELQEKINENLIDDSFTLSAFMLYKSKIKT